MALQHRGFEAFNVHKLKILGRGSGVGRSHFDGTPLGTRFHASTLPNPKIPDGTGVD